jgi:chromosome segregation ATPase
VNTNAAAEPESAEATQPHHTGDDLSQLPQLDLSFVDSATREELVHWISKAAAKMQKYHMKFHDLANAYKTLQQAKDRIEKMLETQQDESLIRIREIQDQYRRDTEAKAKLIETLQQRVTDKDRHIAELTSSVDTFKQIKQAMEADLAASQLKLKRFETGQSSSTVAFEALQKQLATSVLALEETKKERDLFETQSLQLSDRCQSLETQLAGAQQTSESLTSVHERLNQVHALAAQLSDQLEISKRHCATLEVSVNEKDDLIATLEGKLSGASEALTLATRHQSEHERMLQIDTDMLLRLKVHDQFISYFANIS